MSEEIELKYDENLNCPVCLNIFVNPRIYECGHSVCEECMHNCDKEVEEQTSSNFDIPKYVCPICRKETIIDYKYRPLNRRLITLLDNVENYKKIYKSKNENFKIKKEEQTLYNNINFSHLAFKSKYMKCEKYYNEILPLIYKAAKEGKSYISILSNSKELQTVFSMLSKKLFKHGIYKIQALQNEFNIYILPENVSRYRFEQVNPSFNIENNSVPSIQINLEEEFNSIINPTTSSV